MSDRKVIIVGGGCAGLSAAYHLLKKGWEPVVYEAQNRVGGRMGVYRWNGYLVDEYAQFVHPSYKRAKEMLTDMELIKDLQEFDLGGGMNVWFRNHWVSAFPNPEDPEAVAANKEWIDYMGEDNFNAFVGYCAKYCEGKFYEGSTDWMMDCDKDDGSNFGEFVKENFGERVLEYFVQPVVASLGLEYPEKCGVAFGLQIVWTVLVGGAAVLKGGLGRLASVIADLLGENLHVNTPVKEIVIEDKKTKGILLESGEFIACDKVVCATTAPVALQIIPQLPECMRKPIERVTLCRTIHSTLFFDRKLTDGKKPVGGLLPRELGEPFCTCLFQSSRNPVALPDDDSDAMSVFYFGEDQLPKYWDMSEEEILEHTFSVVKKYFKELPDHYIGGHVVKAPQANFTMQNGCPTAIKEMREKHYRDIEGLFFSGDYMYTGSYEGALNSGHNVACCINGEMERI